jgi:predicted transcriptional regulator
VRETLRKTVIKKELKMKVTEIVQELDLKVFSGHEGLGREITGGYSSDLLSNVMGNADAGTVWITIQTHRNVIAIAALKELAAVIIPSDEIPGEDTVSQSNEEGIPVLGTGMSAFELNGKLYNLMSRS